MELKPFSIGDTVYILGKYLPSAYEPLCLVKARISHIKNRKFVAYESNRYGEWHFSSKQFNVSVFKDKDKAEKEFNRRVKKEA